MAPRSCGPGPPGAGRGRGTSLLALDGAALERRVEALPTIVSAATTAPFRTRFAFTSSRRCPLPSSTAGRRPGSSRPGARHERIQNLTFGSLARIWVPRATDVEPGAFLQPEAAGPRRVRSRSRRASPPGSRPHRSCRGGSCSVSAPVSSSTRRADRRPAQTRDCTARARTAAGRCGLPRRERPRPAGRRDELSTLR